jgi:hypothetical protein
MQFKIVLMIAQVLDIFSHRIALLDELQRSGNPAKNKGCPARRPPARRLRLKAEIAQCMMITSGHYNKGQRLDLREGRRPYQKLASGAATKERNHRIRTHRLLARRRCARTWDGLVMGSRMPNRDVRRPR